MPLDRSAIQRSDFPSARKGYDPAAVDDHLARVAGHVEALQRRLEAAAAERAPAAEPTLAGTAADRVRAIVEAAEASATEIERGARAEAERIRSEAVARSSAHVAGAEQAAEELRQRLDDAGGKLDELVDAFRDGIGRLGADLARMRGRLGERYSETEEPVTPEPELEPAIEEPPEPEPPAPVSAGADVEGARLIALNMALNGQPREETERYLAESFGEIADRAQLLDEVYASLQAG